MELMESTAMEALRRTGHLSGGNSEYVEALCETFLATPDQLSEEWRAFFFLAGPK
jgi:2-oxoglutarate dehydrogenase E1 component